MKVVKLFYHLLSTVLLLALVALAVLLVGVKLIGFTPYAVLSGSMEPLYPVGAVVYIKEVQASDIAVGDCITFTLSGTSTVATHQVVEIDAENGLYYTQGIANDAPDGAPVAAADIVGKVYFCIPSLGYVASAITTPPWPYILACLALMWIIILYMAELHATEQQEKACEAEQPQKAFEAAAQQQTVAQMQAQIRQQMQAATSADPTTPSDPIEPPAP